MLMLMAQKSFRGVKGILYDGNIPPSKSGVYNDHYKIAPCRPHVENHAVVIAQIDQPRTIYNQANCSV
jgi:hypothetical protein